MGYLAGIPPTMPQSFISRQGGAVLKAGQMDGVALYSIKAASELSGVHAQKIRRLQRAYPDLLPSNRTPGGHRVFTGDDVRLLGRLARLLRRGPTMTREEIHQALASGEESSESTSAVFQRPEVREVVAALAEEIRRRLLAALSL